MINTKNNKEIVNMLYSVIGTESINRINLRKKIIELNKYICGSRTIDRYIVEWMYKDILLKCSLDKRNYLVKLNPELIKQMEVKNAEDTSKTENNNASI